MKKLLLLSLFAVVFLSSNLYAQYSTRTALPKDAVLKQDPDAKAALIAAADDTIEARVDERSGAVYYVRHVTSPWSGESACQLVVFDPEKETFVESTDYAKWSTIPDAEQAQAVPQPGVRDSCIIRKGLLQERAPNKAKPRRSSTVKLLAHKF